MSPMVWLYAGFGAFVILVMAIDLVVTRKADVVTTQRALVWTGVCIALALIFVPILYLMFDRHWLDLGMGVDKQGAPVVVRDGARAAAEYLQGWLLEYALSVDNLFVFALIFGKFGVPKEYQHRVLTWGIIATLILRGGMIFAGALLIHRFEWILYLAGAFLVYTGFKMLVTKEDDEFDIDKSRVVAIVRKILPVTGEYHKEHFFVTKSRARKEEVARSMVAGLSAPGEATDQAGGVRSPSGEKKRLLVATPLFLVLIVLNLVDIVFAVDSIPAIFGVTNETFIVFTSNVFAVLGLRALYFVLAHMMDQFRYLKVSLALVLCFIGAKMLAEHWIEMLVPRATLTFISLGFIAAAIGLGIFFSMRVGPKPAQKPIPLPPLGEKDAI